MELKVKKILAKEFLFLFVALLIPLLVWVGLMANNIYQRTHKENLSIEISKKQHLIDSLSEPLKKINGRYSNLVSVLFEQYGTCKGGIGDNGLPIAPIPNGFKITEKIGSRNKIPSPFEVFGGKQIFYKSIFRTYDKKDPLRILTKEGSDELMDKTIFADSLRQNSVFRSKVYEELKNVYDFSNCPQVNDFTKMLEIPIPDNVVNWDIEAKRNQKEVDQLNNERRKTTEREVTHNEFLSILRTAILISFLLLFVLRYIFFCLRWSISILKK